MIGRNSSCHRFRSAPHTTPVNANRRHARERSDDVRQIFRSEPAGPRQRDQTVNELLDTHSGDGSRDHQLLDLRGSFEDRVAVFHMSA